MLRRARCQGHERPLLQLANWHDCARRLRASHSVPRPPHPSALRWRSSRQIHPRRGPASGSGREAGRRSGRRSAGLPRRCAPQGSNNREPAHGRGPHSTRQQSTFQNLEPSERDDGTASQSRRGPEKCRRGRTPDYSESRYAADNEQILNVYRKKQCRIHRLQSRMPTPCPNERRHQTRRGPPRPKNRAQPHRHPKSTTTSKSSWSCHGCPRQPPPHAPAAHGQRSIEVPSHRGGLDRESLPLADCRE